MMVRMFIVPWLLSIPASLLVMVVLSIIIGQDPGPIVGMVVGVVMALAFIYIGIEREEGKI